MGLGRKETGLGTGFYSIGEFVVLGGLLTVFQLGRFLFIGVTGWLIDVTGELWVDGWV